MAMIQRLVLWLWNSPTFTTWGNYLVQSLRLLIVTPLILTHFNELEIAAWYLFASLNVFGAILTQRISLTFTRMLAFAMGGATSLEVITSQRRPEGSGKPSWSLLARAYGTVGTLVLVVSAVNLVFAGILGWYGLGNLIDESRGSPQVWCALVIFLGSSFLQFAFISYQIALIGMNYVAIANRWGVVWGIVSAVVGLLVLFFDGGIIALTIGMQVVALAGVFWNRILLHRVENGRICKFRSFLLDREVIGWAWGPTWKGMVGQFGLSGGLQLSGIVFAAYASKAEAASYLFALRMMQTIIQFSHAPFIAVQPLMSRLRLTGEVASLRRLVLERGGACLILMFLGIVALGVFLEPILSLLGSNMSFINRTAWFIFGGLMLLVRFNVLCSTVCGVGNEIVFYIDYALATIIGAVCFWLIGIRFGYLGPILAFLTPLLVILNVRPFYKAKQILNG